MRERDGETEQRDSDRQTEKREEGEWDGRAVRI